MTEEILRLAAELGGVADGAQGTLATLCRQAQIQMAGRLRDGVGPEDCAPAFALGCAWLALADLRLGQEDGFTAGGFTLRPGKGGDELRQRAETVMAPYLRDAGFGFAGVRG